MSKVFVHHIGGDMPISQMPQTHILVSARMLVKSTIAVLSQERWSGQRVDEAILSGAVRLLESYKYDRFDFSNPHHPQEVLQQRINEAESAQLRMAMFAVGVSMFPNDSQENIARMLQESIRRFVRREDVHIDSAREYFTALLPKLNA